MRAPDGEPLRVVMNFNQSLRGLSVGAPIDFRGIVLGEVTNIGIDYDPKTRNFMMPVTMNVYPDRLGRRFRESVRDKDSVAGRELLQRLVKQGLRGQLRTGNLITSQLYIALDLFPKAAPATVDVTRDPVELPTIPNTLDELQLQVADIAKKLDQVPFDLRLGRGDAAAGFAAAIGRPSGAAGTDPYVAVAERAVGLPRTPSRIVAAR